MYYKKYKKYYKSIVIIFMVVIGFGKYSMYYICYGSCCNMMQYFNTLSTVELLLSLFSGSGLG